MKITKIENTGAEVILEDEELILHMSTFRLSETSRVGVGLWSGVQQSERCQSENKGAAVLETYLISSFVAGS